MEEKEMTVTEVKKKELCNLKLKREKGGITITVKSDVFEDFFKGLSNGEIGVGSSSVWGSGMKYYKIPNIAIENDGSYSRNPEIMQWGTITLIDIPHARDNFSFIRAVGITEGVSITYPGLFLTRDIERFRDNFKKFITKFYVEYMKMTHFEISVTSIE